MVSKQTAG